MMTGPLTGLRVVELGGIGPTPYCGMLLGDLGAEVIRIERASSNADAVRRNPHMRNRRSIALNLKSDRAVELVLRLLARADACTEGFRPGVAERLGFGPDVALSANRRLVYARMTGWGQTGPLAQAPGHDINYVALTGALHAIGPSGGKPTVPLNLVGDFGGGGLFLAFAILAGVLEARQSGQGQVIDAAMVDGVASLMSAFGYYRSVGLFNDERPGANPLGGAAHYYDVYETKDGKYVSIGSLEPEFYEALMQALDLDRTLFEGAAFKPARTNDPRWPELKAIIAERFLQRTQAQWCALLEGGDVCFSPVLAFSDAPKHPHNLARNAYVDVGGSLQNAPAPRFSRTPAAPPAAAPLAGHDNREILAEIGVSDEEFADLVAEKVVT
jgi:alpha-methylacyl-CoA racemase